MNLLVKRDKRTQIDVEIDRCLERMTLIKDQTCEEYKKCMSVLDSLIDAKNRKEPKKDDRNKLNPNTVLTALTSFGNIFAIMNFEKEHIFVTKALGFVTKPKI